MAALNLVNKRNRDAKKAGAALRGQPVRFDPVKINDEPEHGGPGLRRPQKADTARLDQAGDRFGTGGENAVIPPRYDRAVICDKPGAAREKPQRQR